MGLYQTLGDDLKQAMKAGDAFKRDTLRLLQSAVKNVAIDKRVAPADLVDADVLDVIKKLVKQRKDSITSYRAGGREDLATKEEEELALLATYLPEAMPESELEALVAGALTEAGLTTKDQMGQAMGVVMKKVAGRASGDDVKRVVLSILS
ncbi:MAG: GatB/YqeY domain-containing protein [Candidatus Moranbacteria bacterium]|nr:GatB/YqeY domain-containing protein [Candidatus Moranbacteria bacterium]